MASKRRVALDEKAPALREPVQKRRAAPSAYSSLMWRSAVRIQRALRRRLFAVKNWRDPVSLELLCRRRAFEVVEPRGAVYLFDPRQLWRCLVYQANFTHPLTRRGFAEVEVLRLAREGGSAADRALLHLTWRFREKLHSNLEQQDSLPLFLESECGRIWGELLDIKEVDADDDEEEGLLDAYDQTLKCLCARTPEGASLLVAVHRQQLERRGVWIAPRARTMMDEFLRVMEDYCRSPEHGRRRRCRKELPALASIPIDALAMLGRLPKCRAADSPRW
jgi:hypothetical protein